MVLFNSFAYDLYHPGFKKVNNFCMAIGLNVLAFARRVHVFALGL